MTEFSRYYQKNELIVISMSEIEKLIQSEVNKQKIAKFVFERLYSRFLKIFDFNCDIKKKYMKHGRTESNNVFNEEFKNGFLQMAACSLLIETFSAFLTGENETPKNKSIDRFTKVFEYAEAHQNELKIFKNTPFYSKIRCGILHQGETKGKYTIIRKGIKLLEEDKIDAYLFHKYLKELLESYKKELENNPWDSEIWDSCRLKIRHIINNSK